MLYKCKLELILFFFVPFHRGKLEKEKREKAKQLGLIRVEGSDGAEDMEREKRVFQLQMCEVRGFKPVKTPEALFRFTSHGWSVMFTPTVDDKTNSNLKCYWLNLIGVSA